jgi:hypothetical protein
MRGSIFVEFMAHLEQRYGLENVDAVISTLGDNLKTSGAYTAVGDYPHEEMLAIAQAVCEKTNTELAAFIQEFAEFLIGAFQRTHPQYFERTDDVFEFLESIESIIHRDVVRLYPDSQPPLVRLERLDGDRHKLTYQSHRPLAPLALCLTELSGAAFGQPLEIKVLEQTEDGRQLSLELRKAP